MREIKFRVWIPNKKVMTACHSFLKWQSLHHVTYPEILMQYTGFKDKNGTEVYEGDVVKFSDYSHLFEVVYTPAKFWLIEANKFIPDEILDEANEDFSIQGDATYDLKNFEVIGNIYENRELLK